jgi:hypothetical protein
MKPRKSRAELEKHASTRPHRIDRAARLQSKHAGKMGHILRGEQSAGSVGMRHEAESRGKGKSQ